jgi:lysine 6-dehydrogenase
LSYMKILALGCGNIGSVAAKDFAKSMSSVKVVIADKESAKAREVAERIDVDNVSWMRLDASNTTELLNALKNFDLVIGFLPGKLGYGLAKACIAAERDLVDVSFMSENPLALNEEAVRAGVTIVPDCGLAPGISNILVGHALSRLDSVQDVHITVGGLPEKATPPLGYTITWSPESLIDEYSRRAMIIRNHEEVEVEALSGLETVIFPEVGELEAFYTDGLRTLLSTVENARSMWEKTLRYKGHAEKIRLLKELGFFDEKPVEIDALSLPPRRLTAKLLELKLRKPEIKDIVLMKVEVCGFEENKRIRYVYRLLDRYDEERGITAMARTTAYPASIMAQLTLKKLIKQKGVVPPEKIGMKKELFDTILAALERRGIRIREEIVD